MKKIAMATLLAAAVFGGVKWARHDDRGRNIATNRLWIDHLPTSDRDPFHVFFAHTEGIGGFADETMWRGQIERFRFELEGNTLHAVFPWSNTIEDITVSARACHEQDMDYCLEISGSSHGVKRYYSRKGWERRGAEDLEALETRALAST
ncbi:MAG TPA: hypothetical protein VGM90_30515 [Kofleriaceae bacterium]|jgi:hypothetical protein